MPATLLSGDHGRVADWRRAHALRRTLDRRPDLLSEQGLTEAKRRQLAEFDLGGPHDATEQPPLLSSDRDDEAPA